MGADERRARDRELEIAARQRAKELKGTYHESWQFLLKLARRNPDDPTIKDLAARAAAGEP